MLNRKLFLYYIRPLYYRNISLDEFRRAVYDEIVSQEPLAIRFAKLSTSGDRWGMVEMLVEMPRVAGLKLDDSYQGKDDAQAARLYERSLEAAAAKPADEHVEEIRTCNILTKALFAASANGRVFLDALCERARRSYCLSLYASCLRDCECMLALPASFYNDSAESVKYFVQRKKECLQLERECSRKLEGNTSSRKRGGRTSSSSSFSPSSLPLGKRATATTPTVDGRPHGSLMSCSDSVELCFDERSRGRHLVATRDIRPGTVLIVDRPFSFSTDAPALSRNCLHCHATLKLEDSVKIPCRNCQTVSREHARAMYISATSLQVFLLIFLSHTFSFIHHSLPTLYATDDSILNILSRFSGVFLHGNVSPESMGDLSSI